MENADCDLIVVGARSAGCVLANRPSEHGKYRVVLLETGSSDTSFWIHLPTGYGKPTCDKKVNWAFSTKPVPTINNRPIYWPRGKVVGGSINGLIAIRGQSEDFDGWAVGNLGWSWTDVLPHFRKLENNPDHMGTRCTATGGSTTIGTIKSKHGLIEAAIAADPPAIQPNELDTEEDCACAPRAVAFVRRLVGTELLKSSVAGEFRPGLDASGDTAFLEYARNSGAAIFHAVGICGMGSEAEAVLDPRLKVRGVDQLWVADDGAMPIGAPLD